jgi:hypothetical protein
MHQPAVQWIRLHNAHEGKRLSRLLKGDLQFRAPFTREPIYLVLNDQLKRIDRAGIAFDRVKGRPAEEISRKGCVLLIKGTLHRRDDCQQY